MYLSTDSLLDYKRISMSTIMSKKDGGLDIILDLEIIS